ncbi:MAG: efflux RND transporter periplasmic adaptor subunit [Pseudomonadales bacterium]|nr:efflux RND transporter periplasmic adaptor subunit [Pseudomonadales bacterium]
MKKIVMPLLIVVAGFGIAALLIATGPRLEPRAPEQLAPAVRTQQVQPETVTMTVSAHGTVKPRTETELVPEVSGRVTAVSDAMVSGGFFSKGQLLLSIEKLDYQSAVDQARAGLARAGSEHENAKKNYERLLDLQKKQLASNAQVDDAMNRFKIATASLAESRSRLLKAERDLERTSIYAPWDGRVRSERVDVGQFVSRGVAIASLYATDYAEVSLPVHDEELAFLDLDLGSGQAGNTGIPVTLSADFGGERAHWQGYIVRTEGELDPQTRMLNLIARVDAPYSSQAGQPPLAVGMFVSASITGHRFDDIVALPRPTLRGSQVLIVDQQQRLRFRPVEVLRVEGETAYIRSGLNRGDQVCLSPIDNVIDGMPVRPVPGVAEGQAQ